MAALVKQEPLLRELFSTLKVGNIARYTSLPPRKQPPQRKPAPKIYHTHQKLEAKGYLRPLKPYSPPSNVEELLQSILKNQGISLSPDTTFKEPLQRYRILEACFQAFQHGVPNSLLHNINNVGDVLEFYKTPVDRKTPVEHMTMKDLPPNLHIQLEPKRFDPDDSMFGGISAFPQSPTLVSSIKGKKKYKSTEAQNWTKDWREISLGYIRW